MSASNSSGCQLLVVDDDPEICDLVTMYLGKHGYSVDSVADGKAMDDWLARQRPDLVILDLMLPGEDGLSIARRLRESADLPIIMVSARGEEVDRIVGLEIGADDYMTKPFSPRELVARVKAVLRRTDPGAARDRPAVLDVGDQIVVDAGRREVLRRDEPVALATREFDLLRHLAEHRGLALSRRQILDGVWGADWVGDDRTVDVHVGQLRKKLGDDLPLTTVWGVGYRLD
jgi:DNA-binding response OmpR family regulator